MVKSETIIRVFIASPGDLSAERSLFPSIIDRLNKTKAIALNYRLEARGWEDALPGFGRPQEIINDDVRQSDILVMLLWKRWGTPSGRFSSGTEEEFSIAYERFRQTGTPRMLLYFRSVPETMLADPGEQLKKVIDFKNRIAKVGLYRIYDEPNQWEDQVISDLSLLLDQKEAGLDSNTASGPEYIAFALFEDKLKVVSLSPDGTYKFLDDAQNLYEILYLVSPETLALETAVEELESLINNPNAKEQAFQDFFERNPDFILSDEYKKAHPHIALINDEGESLIPDFVLEPFEQHNLCDLLELKLPSEQVFVLKKRRKRFSAAVMEACAQLREYSAFFDEESNRRKIYEKHHLQTYRPKMFVIIGRRGNLNPIELRQVQSDLPNLHLRTYDDVINRMRIRIDAMKRGRFMIPKSSRSPSA